MTAKTKNYIHEILVFKNPLSDDVIFECSTKSELDAYCRKMPLLRNEIEADQISINGEIMYGWDEIERFVK